jgi:hypothetical protein
MTTFTINEQNEIVGFASAEEARASTTTPFDTLRQRERPGGTGGAVARRAAGGHLEQPAGCDRRPEVQEPPVGHGAHLWPGP